MSSVAPKRFNSVARWSVVRNKRAIALVARSVAGESWCAGAGNIPNMEDAKKPSAQPATPQTRLKIEYLPIESIKPNPRNPRKHSRNQIKKLAKVIERQGMNSPLVVDRNRNLLAGHARYEACKRLGLKEVPVICLEHLDMYQARAFMLADNRLAELSTWNETLLAEHLMELSQVLDFDLELTGFEIGQIDLRIEGIGAAGVENANSPAIELLRPLGWRGSPRARQACIEQEAR
jgi:hypothetical protein